MSTDLHRRRAKWGKSLRLAAASLMAGYLVFTLGWAWVTVHPTGLPLRLQPGHLGLPHENVSFPSAGPVRERVRLAGWLMRPQRPTGTVLLCHGYPGNRGEFLPMAPALFQAGWNVFAFDFRGLGQSGKAKCTIGREEVKDLKGAVDYLRHLPELRNLPLGVLGYSMGGAVAIMAAAETSHIDAVVADSAYANLARPVRQRLRYLFGRAGPTLFAPGVWLLPRLIGGPLEEVSPERVIKKLAPRPVFLIHGAADRLLLPEDAVRLYRAAGRPRDLWVVAGAGHVGGFALQREEYQVRVVEFFRQAFAERAEPLRDES